MPKRPCNRAKLVRRPSEATTSPSTTNRRYVVRRGRRPARGSVPLSGWRFRDNSRTLVAVAECQAAHPVEFALEDPLRVGEALLGQGGQGRCSPIGHRLVVQGSADGPGRSARSVMTQVIHCASGQSRTWVGFHGFAPRVCLFVVAFDQQPRLVPAFPNPGERDSRRCSFSPCKRKDR